MKFFVAHILLLCLPGLHTAENEAVCRDEVENCEEWANSGECETGDYIDYMLSNCKKSCGKCAATAACEDEFESCESWAKDGECITDPEWMSTNCKKSCGKCGKTPVDGVWGSWSSWSECSVKCGGGSQERKRSCTAPQHGGEQCKGSASETRTCNTNKCPAATCVDKDTSCEYWAKDGGCKNYADWMSINCQKSCGKCPGATTSCAIYKPSTRIVGGERVRKGEIPWQARLSISVIKNGLLKRYICGGTILSTTWILTAQHCFDGGVTKEGVKVYLGDHDQYVSDGETEYDVSDIVMGPATYRKTDIALLKLTKPATFSENVKPACLPTSHVNNLFEGKSLLVTGWGRTTHGGQISRYLLKINVRVVSNKVCSYKYTKSKYTYHILENEICAMKSGKDSCQGDSGGPAVWVDETSGQAVVVGVVSWGEGCADPKFPGVYVRVTKYLDWIKKTIKA